VTHQTKRPASRDEILRACFIKRIDADSVVDAWVSCAGEVELVMAGFIDRCTVRVGTTQERA
jgi:hypothetical protein